MSLYAIGDLHLSLKVNKPMDVFGPGWADHVRRLEEGFSRLGEDDVTVLCGDTSWGIGFAESLEDFRFLHRLPGRKIILKGNHDYWWNTAAKMRRFFAENGLDSLEILHNNCFFYGEYALCGTRGWFYEEEQSGHNEKVFNRGGAAPGGVPEGCAGAACHRLPPLPAPLHRLPLPRDHQKAGGIPGGAVFLRASPRSLPQAGRGGDGGERGLQPGGGGLSGIYSEKNIGLVKKTLVI